MYDKKDVGGFSFGSYAALRTLFSRLQQSRKLSLTEELESFKGRTKEQITTLWQTAEIADYESIFEEGKQSSYVAPYSGGTVRQDVLDNVWRNLNYYRYLIGSPQITERFVNQPDMQNASVLQAINLRDRENGVGLTHSLLGV